ncbi:hypothetical protein V6N13_074757 [Hibiscus sabdariffa]
MKTRANKRVTCGDPLLSGIVTFLKRLASGVIGGNEGLWVEAGSLELSFGLELCVFKGFYLFLGTRRETSSFRVTPSWPLDKGENRDDKNFGCKVEVMFLRCLSRKPSTLLRKSPFAVATWAMVRSQVLKDIAM